MQFESFNWLSHHGLQEPFYHTGFFGGVFTVILVKFSIVCFLL